MRLLDRLHGALTGTVVGLACGLAFLGFGSFACYRIGGLVRRAIDVRGWVPAEAQIRLLELEVRSQDEGVTERVVCWYRYAYDGVSYLGQRVDLAENDVPNEPNTERLHHELLKRKQAGGEPVFCYVNPRDPQQAVLFRELRWRPLALWIPFALGFPLFGGVILGGMGYGLWRTRRKHAIERQHPGEPWLWRADWATAVVRPTTGRELFRACFFCLVWNAIAWPMTLLVGADVTRGAASPLGWLVVIFFPLVGLLLLHRALCATVSHARYGRSELRLRIVPVRLGGTLEAELSLPGHAHLPRELRLELQCVGQVPSADGNTDKIGWRSAQTVPLSDAGYDSGSLIVPVRFRLPADGIPSTYPEPSIRWRLNVTAAAPARGLKLEFPVPVFSGEHENNVELRETETPPPLSSRPGGATGLECQQPDTCKDSPIR
jgi:hypothetical protein